MDTPLQFFPVMVVGFTMALGLTPLSRQIAMRLGVVDKPTLPRKLHVGNKPMMGGLAIYVALVLALLVFSPAEYLTELIAISTGAGLLAIVGALDDRFNLGVRIRLVVMFIATTIVILSGVQIRLLGIAWIDIPMTYLWIIALTNAANFLDNMDGLTAGFSAIACGFFLLIAVTHGQILVSLMAAAIFGSAMGFLAYNFNPASTFMGDMGALVLGFLQAILAIKLQFGEQPISVTWMIPVLVLALPIFDINLVVWTRLSEKRSPFEGGRDHTSHRIMAVGFSQRITILIIYLFCVLFGLLAFTVSIVDSQSAWFAGMTGLGVLGVAYLIMIVIRQRIQKKK
jgi:UDP-GlcNAc:undecaprenyl-phosphate/decaprenyl-phosphate GlcNAc-1-phosphate transferase